jgi:leucine dehydrogenase
MNDDLAAQIAGWDGLGVVARHDEATGSWIFIALHDDSLGPPTGGTRMKSYPSPAAALADAQRLAAGMTRKWAAVGFGFGGGKAVIAVPAPLTAEAREALLLRYGRLIESLRGAFGTGPDLGTTPADMVVIARATRQVHGVDFDSGEAVDPGPFTARGVLAAIRAALAHATGSSNLAGRTVLVQGTGSVGRPLAAWLAEAGAQLKVSDVDAERAAAVADELGGAVVAPEAVAGEACDVYAPCAVGAVLDRHTIPQLACRVVVGSANNQLAEAEDAERLHRRGILYAPDYIANGGGAIGFALLGQGAGRAAAEERVEGIGLRLAEIFREAQEVGASPLAVAERRVEAALAEARAARRGSAER